MSIGANKKNQTNNNKKGPQTSAGVKKGRLAHFSDSNKTVNRIAGLLKKEVNKIITDKQSQGIKIAKKPENVSNHLEETSTIADYYLKKYDKTFRNLAK